MVSFCPVKQSKNDMIYIILSCEQIRSDSGLSEKSKLTSSQNMFYSILFIMINSRTNTATVIFIFQQV